MVLFQPLLWYPSRRSINEANLTRNKEAKEKKNVGEFCSIIHSDNSSLQ